MKQCAFVLVLGGTLLTANAFADSLENFSIAVGGSAQASVELLASGAQVTVGAVAVPLEISGAVLDGSGHLSTEFANELWAVANAPISVDDDIVIAQEPPSLYRDYDTED